METNSNTKTQALAAKKACKMAALHLKKAISNTNILLVLLLKHGNKLAAKAHDTLRLNNHSILDFLICGSSTHQNDVVPSFPAFKEYEFSCSNSPAFQLIPGKLRRRVHHNDLRRCRYKPVDEAAVAAAVQRVFDMLNNETAGELAGSAAATPMLMPGFGKSPAVRQLRVTDSPFPVKENEEESRMVSKAAEEFIRKFYRDLKREKSFESPFRHNHS